MIMTCDGAAAKPLCAVRGKQGGWIEFKPLPAISGNIGNRACRCDRIPPAKKQAAHLLIRKLRGVQQDLIEHSP